MAAVIRRHPRGLLGITAAGVSASVSYAVYNYFGAQVDPEILLHVENLIAEIPTPDLPLEDVVPASFSSAVQYYTPTFLKNVVSADFLASHDWCLYALTGIIIWATVSDTLLTVAYNSRNVTEHQREEAITRERNQYEAVIKAKNKENGQLRDSLDAAKIIYDTQAYMLKLDEMQQAEVDKSRQNLREELAASQLKCQEDKETIKTLSKDLEVADAKIQHNAHTIAEQSATITHLEEKNMGLEKTNRDLLDRTCSLETENDQKDGTITRLGEHNEQLTKSVDDLTVRMNIVSTLNARQSEEIAASQHDNEEIKKSVAGLETRVESLKRDNSRQANSITQSNRRNAELERTVTDLRSEVSTLEARKCSLEYSAQADKTTITQQDAKIVELQRKEGQDKCTKTKLKEQIRTLEDGKASTEASLATANARCTSPTGDLKKANAAKTKGDYEALDNKYRVLQADKEQDAAKYESTTDILKRKINDLEGAVRKNDETTAAQKSTLLGLKSEIKSRNATIGNLQDENKILKHDLEQSSSTTDDLHCQNNSLQSDLKQSSTTISHLQAQITALQHDLTTARDTAAAKNNTLAEDQRRADTRKFGNIKATLSANATDSLRAQLKSKDREIEALQESKGALQEKFTQKTMDYEALQHSKAQLLAEVKELEEMMERIGSVEKSQQEVPAEGQQDLVVRNHFPVIDSDRVSKSG
ncbi:MAG: hypothetical protein Q9200_004610 [Gallowayella weberi]